MRRSKRSAWAALFDHRVSAERLCRDQIDDEIELGRLLDRNVSWLRSAQI
jgi:hypothetical protein